MKGSGEPSKQLRIDIDKEVVLPIVLKELDHLQAIVGRYDTFLFLMKQISLATVFAAIGSYLSKPYESIRFLIAIPLIFFLFEYSFRCTYWAPFIERILEIERFFQAATPGFTVYRLNIKIPLWRGVGKALKLYDVLFYGIMAVVIWLLVAYFGNHPPK